MSRRNILGELSAVVRLTKQSTLPTKKEVILGYNWHLNQSKAGAGPSFNPRAYDIESLVLADVKETWAYASLESCMVSNDRAHAMVKTLMTNIAKLRAQPKARFTAQSYIDKHEKLEQECNQLFDLSACKGHFDLPENFNEYDIPCTKKWHVKVSCKCSMEKRIHPRELNFLLDQRKDRRLSISGLDLSATAHDIRVASGRRNTPSEPVPSSSNLDSCPSVMTTTGRVMFFSIRTISNSL